MGGLQPTGCCLTSSSDSTNSLIVRKGCRQASWATGNAPCWRRCRSAPAPRRRHCRIMRDLVLVAGPFNFATFLSVLVPGYELITRRHGEGYVAKLRSLPSFVDGWIAGLRDGAASGRVATARGVPAAVAAFDALLEADLADDPLASQSPPIEASEAEREAWRADVLDGDPRRRTTRDRQLRTVLHDELLPAARVLMNRPGSVTFPVVARATATCCGRRRRPISLPRPCTRSASSSSPCSTTSTGSSVLPPLGIDDPAQIRERLRSDASLRYATADEIIADAMATLARAEAEAPRWFTRLPSARCAGRRRRCRAARVLHRAVP